MQMPRFSGLVNRSKRPPPKQGPISYQRALEVAQVFRDTQDMVTRHYKVSERCHTTISVNRNNDYVHEIMMWVQGTVDTSSLWPGDLTPAEMVKCAEIRAMLDDWKSGRIEAMPPSTMTMDEADDLD